ncbi:MAG: hypothetical protein RTU09_09305 [Candidatus Thorarchaeota archaeon]
MPQAKGRKKSKSRKKKPRYLFKITVVGPDDKLLEDVLGVLSAEVIAVDGIRISSAAVTVEKTDVKTLFMSPKHSALDILLSVTFTGASGAIIVLKEADPEMETLYRNEVREEIGAGVPTRVITIGSGMDDFKRNEIAVLLDEMVEEILDAKVH